MNSDSLKKPVDLQGLSLALAKTKADYLSAIQDAPQSDWAQNDGGKSTYIENRTHYSYIDYNYNWLTDYEFTTTGVVKTLSWSALYDISPDLAFQINGDGFIEGETYTVTYNGTSYDLVCYVFSDSSLSTKYCLGDSGHGTTSMQADTAHADANVPFLLYQTASRTNGANSLTFRTDGAGTYTVSIIGPAIIYNKLNSNYLDGKLIQYGSGQNAEIFNYDNEASGIYSHAEGFGTTASGSAAHAEGGSVTASGSYSHAEGYHTIASGSYSHSEGDRTIASGEASHTEGYTSQATAAGAHAEGGAVWYQVTLSGDASAVTYTLSNDNVYFYNVQAIIGSYISPYSNFTGVYQVVDAVIENNTLKSITLNKTLSTSAVASKTYYLWIGNTASGSSSHAEGAGTYASGADSHCEGQQTYAIGARSHAEGRGTIAASEDQHVQGRANIIDASGTYAEIVGNGTGMLDEHRSNARTLDWSGNEVLAGKLTVGAAPTNEMDVATKAYVDSHGGVQYTLSMSGSTIILTGSDGSTSSINLPIYDGGVA